LLAQVGLLDRIRGEDGSRRYAVCEAERHHHHFVCTICGAVVVLDGCALESQVQALSRQHNFEVEGHHLELYGRCERCRRGAAQPRGVTAQ
jgi:Fur family ferric uptake transcriptional regulator